MSEYTTEQITQYLKTATELETSVYRQTETIKASKAALKLDEPHMVRPVCPKQKEYKRPEINFKKKEIRKKVARNYFVSGIFVIFLGAILIGSLDYSIFGIIACCIGVIEIFVGIGYISSNAEEETYKKEMAEYEIATAKEKNKYEAELKVYRAEKRIYDENYGSFMEKAKNKYAIAHGEVTKMEQALTETQTVLEKLYATDVIFPKYRGLVPVSVMCEYFLTGRCSELTGSNGAYNLYESELRQNLIINKLDQIVENLEMIRDSQYMLYSELKSMNEHVQIILNDIKDLCDTTKSIEYSTRVAANYAEITAKNTEALKYINLIDG